MIHPLQHGDIPPHQSDLTNFYRYNGAFSDEDIYAVTQLAEGSQLSPGTAGGQVNPDYRRQNITWLENHSETAWIYAKVAQMIEGANQLWGFNLDGMREGFQFGQYKSEEKGFYDWHLDMGTGASIQSHRKISVVVQLSDRSKFTGGELQFMTGKSVINSEMNRGDVILFPSYMLHRVTPVTEGERYSLVLWAHGRRFQ